MKKMRSKLGSIIQYICMLSFKPLHSRSKDSALDFCLTPFANNLLNS